MQTIRKLRKHAASSTLPDRRKTNVLVEYGTVELKLFLLIRQMIQAFKL